MSETLILNPSAVQIFRRAFYYWLNTPLLVLVRLRIRVQKLVYPSTLCGRGDCWR
jgi:hypothetical protein